MLIKTTLTKNLLEKIIQTTFENFGEVSTSALLDSLKLLGFYYATNAGVSINIEDLRVPKLKELLLENAKVNVDEFNKQWQEGLISETERFQNLIDNWNSVTETLKNRIVQYYHNFDPLNNLYIMAFSGARGNISQVRQLIGMRGLMSDQDGNIIDLPIQKNFREGLSSVDYIISSYGARKGIVDTALKTADSGYLTRRLIYLCQDLIIREFDCKTKEGAIILVNKNKKIENLLGRTLISYQRKFSKAIVLEEKFLTKKVLTQLKKENPTYLKIRSPLNCKASESICQKCYGGNLAQRGRISLGEAVGIIAAQSIGEPGTQLTMRTFHTGGVFSSETLKQKKASFSGKLVVPIITNPNLVRNNRGDLIHRTTQELSLFLIDWQGRKEEINLPIGTLLYVFSSSFVKKDQILAEISIKFSLPSVKRLKPITSFIEGEIKFEKLFIRYISNEKKSSIRVNQDDGILWITSGKIFPIFKEAQLNFQTNLINHKALAELKFITPFQAYYQEKEKKIILHLTTRKLEFRFPAADTLKAYKTFDLRVLSLVKNNQYLDESSVFAKLYIFPKYMEKIYFVRTKSSEDLNILFFITESDVWHHCVDEIESFTQYFDNKILIKKSEYLTPSIISKKSGFLLKNDGFQMLFQKAFPIFLNKGAFLKCKKGDFIQKNQVIANIIKYSQQTQDIVQGLPKIEEIVDARIASNKVILAVKPSLLVDFPSDEKRLSVPYHIKFYQTKKIIILLENLKRSKVSIKENFEEKEENYNQEINVISSSLNQQKTLYCGGKFWTISKLPEIYKPIESNKLGTHFKFLAQKGNVFSTTNGTKIWEKYKLQSIPKEFIKKFETSFFLKKLKLSDSVFFNKKGKDQSIIFSTISGVYLLLQEFSPFTKYSLPVRQNIEFEAAQYIDLAEPITEGVIDFHDFLTVLTKYQSSLDGVIPGSIRSIQKFQLIVVNSIQGIYQSQGVSINSKHVEIIVRQMTSKVTVTESGDTPLLIGELINLSFITELYKAYKRIQTENRYKLPKITPIILSATNKSLNREGFLSAAGFQETKRVLAKAAIEGSNDWISGLKESIMMGRLIPAGSSFSLYKANLDNHYSFLKTKSKTL